MSLQDVLAAASFLIAVGAMIFALGKQTARMERVENDLNKMGEKVDRKTRELSDQIKQESRLCDDHFRELDRRVDEIANFTAGLRSTVSILQETRYGEEITARILKTDV